MSTTDELRVMAESVGLAMPQAATLMMGAADTIDRLDLALDSKRTAERRVTELLAENAKLQELVRDMFGAYKGVVEMLPPSYAKNVAEMAVMDISDRIRELGVEVDG